MRYSPTIDQLVLVSAGKSFDECGGSMNCRSWAVSFSVEAAPRDCPNPTKYLTNRGWVGSAFLARQESKRWFPWEWNRPDCRSHLTHLNRCLLLWMRPFLTVWEKEQLGQRGIVSDRLARTTANLASLLLGHYRKNLVFFLIARNSHRCHLLFCTSLRCIITSLALLR